MPGTGMKDQPPVPGLASQVEDLLVPDLVEVVFMDPDAEKLSLTTFPVTPTWRGPDRNMHSVFLVGDLSPGTYWMSGALASEIRRPTYIDLYTSLHAAPFKVVREASSIARLSGLELLDGFREIFAVVALADHWPVDDESQNWAGLALGGALCEAEVSPEDAARIVASVTEFGDDCDSSARVDAVGRTYSRHARGTRIVAKGKLEEIVGRAPVRYALSMLTCAPPPQPPFRVATMDELFPQR